MVLGHGFGKQLETYENKEKEKTTDELFIRTERHVNAGNLSVEFFELQSKIENGSIEEEDAQIAIDELMNSLYENKDKEHFYMLLSHLKHRGKARLFTQLEEGDNIVAFLAPSGDSFSTKNLNDKLGYQTNDTIIVERKKKLAELFSENLDVLEQEFKQSFFIVKKGVDVNSEAFNKWMKEKTQKLEGEMDKYLLKDLFPKQLSLVEKQLSELTKRKDSFSAREFSDLRRLDINITSSDFKEDENVEESLDKKILALKLKQEGLKEAMLKLENSLKALENGEILDQENSYKITYGISEVKMDTEDNLPRALVLAESKAICSSQLNRTNKEAYGSVFEFKKIAETSNRLKELRSELLKINKIEIPGELTFFLFKHNLDPETNESYLSLNEELWTALRKGKLKKEKLGEKEQGVLVLLKEYKELVNSIDYFKPYLAEDLDNREEGNVVDTLKKRQEIAEKVNAKEMLGLEEFKEITKVLHKDIKDDRFSSENVFHAEALKIKNCSYINLDVIGLGSKLLADYEQKWFKIGKMEALDEKELNDIFYSVGDKTTKRMQELRGITLEILAKHGIANPVSDVSGGDEIVFAVPNDLVSNELLMELKKETTSRVVHTVVAEAVKYVDDYVIDKDILLKAHVKAQEDGEKAIEHIKEVEASFDVLLKMVQHSGLSDVDFRDEQAVLEVEEYGRTSFSKFLLEQPIFPDIDSVILRQNKLGEFYLKADNILDELLVDNFLGAFQKILNEIKKSNLLIKNNK